MYSHATPQPANVAVADSAIPLIVTAPAIRSALRRWSPARYAPNPARPQSTAYANSGVIGAPGGFGGTSPNPASIRTAAIVNAIAARSRTPSVATSAALLRPVRTSR